MSDNFLEPADIKKLTGRAHIKLQIEALKEMGIPFFVNGIGRPVVTWAAVDGRRGATTAPPKKAWVPRVLKAG